MDFYVIEIVSEWGIHRKTILESRRWVHGFLCDLELGELSYLFNQQRAARDLEFLKAQIHRLRTSPGSGSHKNPHLFPTSGFIHQYDFTVNPPFWADFDLIKIHVPNFWIYSS